MMPLYLHPNKVLATSPILLSTAFHDLLSYRSQESESAGTLEAGMSGCIHVLLLFCGMSLFVAVEQGAKYYANAGSEVVETGILGD